MIKRLIFIGISFFLLTCNKAPKEKETQVTEISNDTIYKIFTKSVFLNEMASKDLDEWKSFDEFENIVEQYYKTTPEKAKLNAKDLSNILIRIKDSITIEKINRPDVKARFNILNNEALRLNDMSTISTITIEEINSKIENIIYAYESIISKINQVYIVNTNEDSVDVKFQAPKVLIDSLPKEVKKKEKS